MVASGNIRVEFTLGMLISCGLPIGLNAHLSAGFQINSGLKQGSEVGAGPN